jgi:gamma-glutamylcyclotransferase
MKYLFAYGCLTNHEIMAQRCPRARIAGSGKSELRGYRVRCCLTFTIVQDANEVVQGVMWRITDLCEESLDEFEGCPWSYTKETLTVFHEQLGVMQVMAYIMTEKIPLEPPQKAYEDAIARGYTQFDIPPEQLHEAVQEAALESQYEHQMEMERIRRLEYFYPYDEEYT